MLYHAEAYAISITIFQQLLAVHIPLWVAILIIVNDKYCVDDTNVYNIRKCIFWK